MKQVKVLMVTGVLLAAVAQPLAAQTAPSKAPAKSGLDYTYVDVGLRLTDYDGPDGVGLGGVMSYDLGQLPRFRLLAGLSYDDIDSPLDNVTNLLFGAGYIHPLAAKTDIVADVGILYSDVDTDFGGDSDTGFRLAAYVRHELQAGFQVEGGLNLVDLFDDSEMGLNLGGYYAVAQDVSLMVRYDQESDVDVLTLGARFGF